MRKKYTPEKAEMSLGLNEPKYRKVIVKMIEEVQKLSREDKLIRPTLAEYLNDALGYQPIANILQEKLKKEYLDKAKFAKGIHHYVLIKPTTVDFINEVLSAFMEYNRNGKRKIKTPIVAATLEARPIQKAIAFNEEATITLPEYTPWETGTAQLITNEDEEANYFTTAFQNLNKRGTYRIELVKVQ